jgi:aldehyde:ferredoxin oxidoreductase
LVPPGVVGSAGGQVVDLELMRDEYYLIMGWDMNGVPTPLHLTELGLLDSSGAFNNDK